MFIVDEGQKINTGDLLSVYHTKDGPIVRRYDRSNQDELRNGLLVAGEELNTRLVTLDLSTMTVVNVEEKE